MRTLLRWTLRLGAASLVLSLALVLAYRFLDPPLTPLMVMRAVQAVGERRPISLDRRWVHLGGVSPSCLRAVLAAEDARFFTHHGIDFDSVRRAWAYNTRHGGRRLRGAGTITMQCARNVFLWPGRSYVRKGLEVYFAQLLELTWGKPRILEVYLNVIEWGDGIYGVEAAAQRYFGIRASQLGPREAALLAAALPTPRSSNPGAPSRYLASRAALIEARAARVRLPLD